nr:immunoglobulin heavy chain junction region [Macaca mulatta]MOX67436.1 immunoglobulin heavy chain junction region [Macaca mulatta]
CVRDRRVQSLSCFDVW